MARNESVAVLDIGTAKVVCLIGRALPTGSLEVMGVGHQLSQGIRGGTITDVRQAESSILAAVNAAEKMAGDTIERVFVNVTGNGTASQIIQVDTSIGGEEITEKDLRDIIQEGRDYAQKDKVEVLHCLPVNYTVDGTEGIADPLGMYAEQLCTDLHIMTVPITSVRNISNCLAHCHLDIEEFVCPAYMSGLSLLTEDEQQLGTILLDIGAGETSIAVFSNGQIVYASSIPVGGGHVTRDIAIGLSISMAHAERIKTLYGSVVTTDFDDREIIDVPLADLHADLDIQEGVGMEDCYISKSLLTKIIKPRMEEVLEMAKKNIETSGFLGISGPRLVLTGGASQITGLKELAGHIFNKHVRVGKPIPAEMMADAIKGPAFATALGMLRYAVSREVDAGNGFTDARSHGLFNRLGGWFKRSA